MSKVNEVIHDCAVRIERMTLRAHSLSEVEIELRGLIERLASARPEALRSEYDQAALDEASRELHMFFLREGSRYGTKACEEIGRVFMTAYLKAFPSPLLRSQEKSDG